MNVSSVDDSQYVTLPGEPAAIRIEHTIGLLNGLRELRDYRKRERDDMAGQFIHLHELNNSELVVFRKITKSFSCALCGGCTRPAADVKYSDSEADVFDGFYYCDSCVEDVVTQLESFTENHTHRLLGDVL